MISEWIPAMFWMGSCFHLAFALLSDSLLELCYTWVRHQVVTDFQSWFPLAPVALQLTPANKQNIFQSFVEVWKESPIPHCLHFENKNTAVFPPTWTHTNFTSSGADRGFLHVILCASCLSNCFPCYWIVSQLWNNQKDLNCQTDLFLCWDRNEMKQAQAKSFHNQEINIRLWHFYLGQ